MGWTADDDPIADVEIKFGSLNSAIRFAERQGINYRVQGKRYAPERASQHDN
jgi:hypothetical protein